VAAAEKPIATTDAANTGAIRMFISAYLTNNTHEACGQIIVAQRLNEL
jgi:hypothetical protein